MPPFTAMLTQTMLFYLKRTQAREYLRCKLSQRHQILHKNSGLVATQYYEKNSGLSALFQYAPIYGHVNADNVILF